MNMVDLPSLLTIKQASSILNVHPNTLRNWERSDAIEVVRIGSRKDRRFPKTEIMKILTGSMAS
jgi:excisionase family DNA binding protein